MAVLESRSSSLTNNLVDTITPTPTKPVAYRIPARRKLDKENVKPPVVTGHGHKTQKVSNGYINFPEFAEALARCRRVQEYVKTKKGGGTKEVVDLTVKNRLGPNSKKVSNKENKEVDLTVKSRLRPNPKRVSNKDIAMAEKDAFLVDNVEGGLCIDYTDAGIGRRCNSGGDTNKGKVG
ncbi:hypothetical protein Tco_0592600 [Tanacetum coccineum]